MAFSKKTHVVGWLLVCSRFLASSLLGSVESEESQQLRMPLVILCGFPASGKTRRTAELQTFLSEKHSQRIVHVVSDESIDVNRNDVYVSSQKEKEVRGSLKSAVHRLLNKDNVVIVDSLNYIKGFRYELYCMSKSCHSTHCVVFCDASKECVTERNAGRTGDKEEAYDVDVLDALVMRFEHPSSANRWDNPLFTVQADDSLPAEDICAALFERKAPKPNQSTQSQPLSDTNFLYELDRVTKEVVCLLLQAQKTSAPGDVVTVPGTKEQLTLTRTVTLAELQRHKRQFITYTKMHPVEDTGKLAGLFVQYLSNVLTV